MASGKNSPLALQLLVYAIAFGISVAPAVAIIQARDALLFSPVCVRVCGARGQQSEGFRSSTEAPPSACQCRGPGSHHIDVKTCFVGDSCILDGVVYWGGQLGSLLTFIVAGWGAFGLLAPRVMRSFGAHAEDVLERLSRIEALRSAFAQSRGLAFERGRKHMGSTIRGRIDAIEVAIYSESRAKGRRGNYFTELAATDTYVEARAAKNATEHCA